MPTEPTAADPSLTEPNATDHGTPGGVEDAAAPEAGCERDAADDDDGDRVAALERRVTELEAELEAVRGLLDGIEAVDEAAERRAAAALAKAEALEERFDPGNDRLVRERLPETGADGRQGRTEAERAERPRDGGTDAEPDPEEPRRGNSRLRGGSSRDTEGRIDSVSSRSDGSRTSPQTVGSGRTRPNSGDAADGGAADAGAISSVGPGGSDEPDADRSLAARLRDAFR